MTKEEREAELAAFEQEFNGGLKLPGAEQGEDVNTLTDAVQKSEQTAPAPAKEPGDKPEPAKAEPAKDKA